MLDWARVSLRREAAAGLMDGGEETGAQVRQIARDVLGWPSRGRRNWRPRPRWPRAATAWPRCPAAPGSRPSTRSRQSPGARASWCTRCWAPQREQAEALPGRTLMFAPAFAAAIRGSQPVPVDRRCATFPERGQGSRRCPKMKYEAGTTPAELTSATAAAHIPFRPRIWLAGRRWMSMSAATRRAPSATATVISSMRARWLRSLHRRLAAGTCSSLRSSASCAAICNSSSSSCRRTSAGRSFS